MAETDAQAWADVEEPVTNYLQAAWIANSADSLEAEISRIDGGKPVCWTYSRENPSPTISAGSKKKAISMAAFSSLSDP